MGKDAAILVRGGVLGGAADVVRAADEALDAVCNID